MKYKTKKIHIKFSITIINCLERKKLNFMKKKIFLTEKIDILVKKFKFYNRIFEKLMKKWFDFWSVRVGKNMKKKKKFKFEKKNI